MGWDKQINYIYAWLTKRNLFKPNKKEKKFYGILETFLINSRCRECNLIYLKCG
jgi:hypothetical protein